MASIRGRHGHGRSAASASAPSESGRAVVRTAAVGSMRAYFPQWTSANLVSPEERARLKAHELSMDQVESPFTDFYLSCNWVFRPDALAEFLEEMRKLPTKADMVYDVDRACFRVRCLRGDEDELMGSASDILARIVDPELEKMARDEKDAKSGVSHLLCSLLPTKLRKSWIETDYKRYRIREIDEWRSSRNHEQADEEYEIFAHPPSLMAMRHRTTWQLPKEDMREAMSISRLLPNDQNLLDLQESTGCIAVRGLDDLSLQLGSNTKVSISIAIAKLNTLLKYYHSVTGPVKTYSHVLNTEGEQSLTELRFLAHINEGFLTSFLLDRIKHRLRNTTLLAYRSVFFTGCVVRMMAFNHHQGLYQPAPDPTMNPAISRKEALEIFAPLKQYEYAPKRSTWLEDSSSNSTTSVAPMDDICSVNPQAAPNVAAWAKRLPASEDCSTEATPTPRQELISWSQTQPSSEGTGSIAYESAVNMLAGLDFTNRKEGEDITGEKEGEDPTDGKESKDLSDGNESEDLIELSPTKDSRPSPLIAAGESDNRVFYSTMRQQTPSRKQPHEEQDEELIGKISNKLISYVEPLRIFQGEVTLKAHLIRLVVTNLHISQVSISTDNNKRAAVAKTVKEQERALDELPDEAVMTTNVISYYGGDMNYIAGMYKTPLDSCRMWEPKSKRVFYEFRCATTNQETKKKTHFVIGVDAESMVYHAYMEGKAARSGSVLAHCIKREYDVQFDVNNAVDLTKICGGFANELVSSLAVRPQNGAPHLTFISHGDWHVDIKSVRVRHAMSYSNLHDTCELEITQVQDLWMACDRFKNRVAYLSARPWNGEPKNGVLPKFYEVCIKSTAADKAFEENKDLGFAEEAKWTGVGLKPAFKDLARTALDVVKRMDGVGARCDNNQKASVHGIPPRSQNEAKAHAQASGAMEPESYW